MGKWGEAGTFYHEMAHVIGTPENWQSIMDMSGREVSEYPASLEEGYVKAGEDFAESLRLAMQHPFAFEEEDPSRYYGVVGQVRAYSGDPAWDPQKIALGIETVENAAVGEEGIVAHLSPPPPAEPLPSEHESEYY